VTNGSLGGGVPPGVMCIEVSCEDTPFWNVQVFESSVEGVGKCLVLAWFFVVYVE
jgi:hypothetical protein